MLKDDTLGKLKKLIADLAVMSAASGPDEWRAIGSQAEALEGDFLGMGDSDAQETMNMVSRVTAVLAKGIIANPDAGVHAIRSLMGAVKGLETGSMSESLRKQAHAEANLFFHDAEKEESAAQEASAFEDDEEQREMIIAIEQRIDELEGDLVNLNPPESDSETVRSIFRQFHTLKGEGAICGIKTVADFCHSIETEIEDARGGNLVLTEDIISALQELSGLIRPILGGQSREEIGEELIESLLQELRDAVARSKEAGAPEKPAEDDGVDKFADFFSAFTPPPDAPAEEEKPAETEEAEPALQEAKPTEESAEDAAKKAEAASNSAADFLAALGLEEPPAQEEKPPEPKKPEKPKVNDADVDQPFGPGPASYGGLKIPESMKGGPGSGRPAGGDTVIESGDMVRQVAAAAPASPAAKKAAPPAEKKVDESKIKAVTIDVTRLDDLLEIVGEVSLLGSFLTTKLIGMESLALQTTNLIRACSRLQATANSLRMTSIRPLFMTVRRAAADAARASRKLININMNGVDTQVDRSIVESLSAALIHIIRNAVDHGIEPADVRKRAGKPERGSIVIGAHRTNSDIVIELGDDGKGFDLKAIHDKAVAMGKIAPDAKLTEEELADLVFLPGLSTAKKITGLSGRGVGMEIVRESIDNLRGKVEIKTEEGKGTTVRMRFPLQVAAIDAMMVRVGQNILAIPVAQVRECFRPTPGDISTIEGRGTIVSIRGIILPVLFLSQEFGIEGEAQEPADGVLVVVETDEMLAAVLVDETLGSSSVVIRSLEGPLAQSTNLVSGAAILPDGTIALVIETTKLTERVATTASKAFTEASNALAANTRQIDTVSIGSNQVGMIDFNIKAPGPDGEPITHVFAINAFKTREFVPLTKLQYIPGSPPGFAGMMMLRKSTVPVIHMGVVLGLMSEYDRREEWEQIVLISEFSGKTVGFLVTSVERVSYISWSDIMPPPSTGGLIQVEYVVGTILMSRLKGTLTDKPGAKEIEAEQVRDLMPPKTHDAQVAFVLDFERIVGNVLQLYGSIEIEDIKTERKEEVRILLVEDSPLIRKQTKKALTKAGITVLEAGDGAEAWDKMCEIRDRCVAEDKSIFEELDLVLTDIEMPQMDGYTLTHNLKADPTLRVLPVLLHSSITNDSMINRAAEVEADGFIPKCDPKTLSEQLKKYL